MLVKSPTQEKAVYKDKLVDAKELALKAKKKYKGTVVQVYLISCHKAFGPPEGWERRRIKRYYWCPYCASERKFRQDNARGEDVCTVCGISTADYWVKTYNHLWPTVDRDGNVIKVGKKKNGRK